MNLRLSFVFLSALLGVLFGHGSVATVRHNGVAYFIDLDRNYAQVSNGRSCRGDIVIMSHVSYDGHTYTVTEINEKAFFENFNLTSVSIPNTIRKIPKSAFGSCYGLESVSIPSSVVCIDDFAFENCNKLDNVAIPESVQKLGVRAFANCGLTAITIPKSIKRLGKGNSNPEGYGVSLGVFAGCKSLVEVNLHNGIDSIGKDTFVSCTSLKHIDLPKSLQFIGEDAFNNCAVLESIEIPDGIECIEKGTFVSCYNLKSVKLPSGISVIKQDAFTACKSMENIDLPDKLEELGSWAFSRCESLKSIVLPFSVSKIGSYCFDGCEALESVDLGLVQEIERDAFKGCAKIRNVYCHWDEPLEVSPRPFYGDYGDVERYGVLHVPAGTGDKYKSSDTWRHFWWIADDVAGVESVGDNAIGRDILCDVYSLDGIKLYGSIYSYSIGDVLPKGIYILKFGNGNLQKIAIK